MPQNIISSSSADDIYDVVNIKITSVIFLLQLSKMICA